MLHAWRHEGLRLPEARARGVRLWRMCIGQRRSAARLQCAGLLRGEKMKNVSGMSDEERRLLEATADYMAARGKVDAAAAVSKALRLIDTQATTPTGEAYDVPNYCSACGDSIGDFTQHGCTGFDKHELGKACPLERPTPPPTDMTATVRERLRVRIADARLAWRSTEPQTITESEFIADALLPLCSDRDAVLEEAARVCDSVYQEQPQPVHRAVQFAGTAIRALKSAPPSSQQE